MPKKLHKSGSKTSKPKSGSKKSKPKSKSMKPNKCPPGTILKKSYDKKGHERHGFDKKTKKGKKVHVKGAYVGKAHVAPTCVPAKGKAIIRGKKTPAREKVLPPIGKEISLRAFGYGTHKPEKTRHHALIKAVEKHGNLKVLKHLNLERNYQADPKAKKIMGQDVKYLSIMRAKDSKKEGRVVKSKYMQNSSKKKKVSGSKTSKKKSNFSEDPQTKR